MLRLGAMPPCRHDGRTNRALGPVCGNGTWRFGRSDYRPEGDLLSHSSGVVVLALSLRDIRKRIFLFFGNRHGRQRIVPRCPVMHSSTYSMWCRVVLSTKTHRAAFNQKLCAFAIERSHRPEEGAPWLLGDWVSGLVFC